MIGTPEGLKPAPCPIEYLVLQAVKYMEGAMGPGDFGIYRAPEDWLTFTLMCMDVDADPRVMKKRSGQSMATAGGGANVFSISRPKGATV